MSTEEEILEGTSWMKGFLDGREQGFEVGLKLGLMTAIRELERLIEKGKEPGPTTKLADELKDAERRLGELGFVRIESLSPEAKK